MRQKFDFPTYNDGIVKLYREKIKKSNFSAKQNVSTMDDLDFVVKLDFCEMSKREQDISFAEQQGFSLSTKIKTRFIKEVSKNHKAIIDGCLYDVSHIDKTRTEMFLYLEFIKELECGAK